MTIFILMMDNSDMKEPVIKHFHHPRCRCGGRETFKANMRKCLLLSCGAGCCECLLYRWKGYEQAACWTFRGMNQHGVLPRALLYVYRNADFKKAEEDLQAAALNGDHNFGAAQTVRAGKILAFFSREADAQNLNVSLAICAPLQHNLNIAFEAEKACAPI